MTEIKGKTTTKKIYDRIPTRCSSTNTLVRINRPHTHTHLFHFPRMHNNNLIKREFLVQMRQSNKLGSVRNDKIFNLHFTFVISFGPLCQYPLAPARCQPQLLIPLAKHLTRGKQTTQK